MSDCMYNSVWEIDPDGDDAIEEKMSPTVVLRKWDQAAEEMVATVMLCDDY